MTDNKCKRCGLTGPFRADTCYGCVKMTQLAQDLSATTKALATVIATLDTVESFEALEYNLGELEKILSTIEHLSSSLEVFLND